MLPDQLPRKRHAMHQPPQLHTNNTTATEACPYTMCVPQNKTALRETLVCNPTIRAQIIVLARRHEVQSPISATRQRRRETSTCVACLPTQYRAQPQRRGSVRAQSRRRGIGAVRQALASPASTMNRGSKNLSSAGCGLSLSTKGIR